MSSPAYPTVSCLLVTADRPALCRRALRCYQQQTYPNTELVVLDNGAEPIDHLLVDLPAAEVRYLRVERSPDLVIGALRNQALDAATGAYVVPQWDDDDWYHPERIERQMRPLLEEGYDACAIVGTLMHVDSPAHFYHPFIGILPDGVPPTIVHRRDDAIRYAPLRRTSDTPYLHAWRERRFKLLPRDEAHLYIRYFHGDNLWEQEHFLRRMRNTPLDLVRWLWYKYVRQDVHRHPRFDLSPAARRAFQHYLDDSVELGLFPASDSSVVN